MTGLKLAKWFVAGFGKKSCFGRYLGMPELLHFRTPSPGSRHRIELSSLSHTDISFCYQSDIAETKPYQGT